MADVPIDNKPPSSSVFSLVLAEVPATEPFQWLKRGWEDFWQCPRVGLFYGMCFFAMGHALWFVFKAAPAYLLALSAGFLLLGPFLCLGIYDASRACEIGQRPSLRSSLLSWRHTMSSMGIFAFVLLVLEMLWGRSSMVVFAVTFDTMPDTQDLLTALLSPENIEFIITYCVVGGVFAGLIFVSSAISIPMILDRKADAVSAAMTSARACFKNPTAMLVWGALITVVVMLSMLPAFLGLIIMGPVLGHATWHAYRSIVPAP